MLDACFVALAAQPAAREGRAVRKEPAWRDNHLCFLKTAATVEARDVHVFKSFKSEAAYMPSDKYFPLEMHFYQTWKPM